MERSNLPGDEARREDGRARGVMPSHMPAFVVAVGRRQKVSYTRLVPIVDLLGRDHTYWPCHNCQRTETAKATAKNTGAPLFGS